MINFFLIIRIKLFWCASSDLLFRFNLRFLIWFVFWYLLILFRPIFINGAFSCSCPLLNKLFILWFFALKKLGASSLNCYSSVTILWNSFCLQKLRPFLLNQIEIFLIKVRKKFIFIFDTFSLLRKNQRVHVFDIFFTEINVLKVFRKP